MLALPPIVRLPWSWATLPTATVPLPRASAAVTRFARLPTAAALTFLRMFPSGSTFMRTSLTITSGFKFHNLVVTAISLGHTLNLLPRVSRPPSIRLVSLVSLPSGSR